MRGLSSARRRPPANRRGVRLPRKAYIVRSRYTYTYTSLPPPLPPLPLPPSLPPSPPPPLPLPPSLLPLLPPPAALHPFVGGVSSQELEGYVLITANDLWPSSHRLCRSRCPRARPAL